jgi:hypothetical protein
LLLTAIGIAKGAEIAPSIIAKRKRVITGINDATKLPIGYIGVASCVAQRINDAAKFATATKVVVFL